MKLLNILENIDYSGNPDSREILNITHDSRKVKKGTLFIAIQGNNNDGHDFIFNAIEKGASAIIANGRAPISNRVPIIQVSDPRKVMSKIAANFFNHPSMGIKIIGVTGTNGKTTTTQIIDHILKNNNCTSSSLGTLGFSSPTGIISTGFTTPESIELHQILKVFKNGGIDFVPMEISSHAIAMNRIDDVNINYAIFTNLGSDHLDFHKSKENYFNTKLKLFKNLKKDSLAFVNMDDEYASQIIKNTSCKCYTYGFNKKSDLYIINYELNLGLSIAKIKYENKIYKIETNLIGKFNLYNLIASILCCLKIGIKMQDILDSLKSFKKVSGRLEKYLFPNKESMVVIDYAHSPDAFEKIFQTIDEFKKNKKVITIFGCGGNRDSSKRPLMAKIAQRFSDYIYITNDNPRYEKPEKIISDIKSGLSESNSIEIVLNRKEAIEIALNKAKKSIILILGKGPEEYQIIKDKKIPHSDIEIVKNYLHANRNRR